GHDKTTSGSTGGSVVNNLDKEFGVYQLIQAYRRRGHLLSKTDPIRERKDRHADLALSFFGLSDGDLATQFVAGKFAGLQEATLETIVAHLKKCYTGSLGVEFDSLYDDNKITWIINAVEKSMLQPVPLSQKKRILQKLNEGVMFEK